MTKIVVAADDTDVLVALMSLFPTLNRGGANVLRLSAMSHIRASATFNIPTQNALVQHVLRVDLAAEHSYLAETNP